MMRTTWMAAVACTVLAVPAFGQVADDAKAVLNESAKAMKAAEGTTFKVKTYATGMLKDIIDLSGEVKIWRPAGAATPTWRVDGRAKDPGKQDREIHVVSDGTTVQWLSYTDNTLYVTPATDPNATEAVSMCKELVLPDWLSPTPFTTEMGMPHMNKTGINNVGGEVCDVVESMQAAKDRNRTWCISAKDRLPRSLELGTGNLAQKISKITEMTEMKPAKFTPADFQIELPKGFIKKETKPNSPNPVQTTPEPKMDLGLKAGTPAPVFSAKDTAGNDVSLSSLKGKVVVLEFWGTMFKKSTEHAADMKALAEKADAKQVQMIGMACRSDDKAATDWWTKSGPGYALVTKADQIASDFKVVGYPSYVVIDADGNVAAFFQDFPGADKMGTAVNDAMKKK